MARSGLAGRLSRIRDQQKTSSPPGIAQPSVESNTLVPLPGWSMVAPFVFERETIVPLPDVPPAFSSHLPLLFPRERDYLDERFIFSGMTSDLVFFDLETTGLSRGAGTVAFMAGLARLQPSKQLESGVPLEPRAGEGRELRITQILLADYPGEVAFLERFSAIAGDRPIFVSFNGKAFDFQILFNRFAMNGLRSPLMQRAPVHLDLLYPSRRIWKNELESCRLAVLEEMILGRSRVDDLPGSEAPEAWFNYVRQGVTEKLLAIGDHNRDDCETLPLLLLALNSAIERGDSRAGLIRAMHLRARGDYLGAHQFLEPLAARGDLLALRMLAVDSEHRTDNLDLALECAKTLADERRIERLVRKIAHGGENG
jgi:uncharacterized protein YprB with RNaseH-like and TPR domain